MVKKVGSLRVNKNGEWYIVGTFLKDVKWSRDYDGKASIVYINNRFIETFHNLKGNINVK